MRKLHLGRQQRLGRQPAAPRFRRLRSEPLETRQMLTITVDTLTDEADGSIDDGDVSLRDAIALAPSGETIDFSVTGTILLTLGELLIDKDLTIDGPGAELLTIDASGNDPTPDSTLDDGDDTNDGDGSRVFNVDDGDDLHNVTVAVGGLAITGGDVDGDGGGVLSKENLALVDAVVNHNNVGDSGRPNGGGIMAYVWNEGTLTIDGTRISYNSASLGGRGGGMYVEIATGGTAAISDSIVTSNSTGGRGDGGGIYAHTDGGVFFISHTSISDNGGGAYRGGGIFAVTTNQARLSITDSNISDNYTFFADDGAIWLETTAHSRVTISRSVISDNSSDGIVADSDGGSTLTLARTVISGNEGKGVQADGRTWILNSVVLDNFGTGLSLDSIGSPFDTSSPSIFVSRTTVAGNESGGGMILNATGGAVEVRDSTVSRNTGSGIGGILVGLHAYRVLITHTTITDNAGGRRGGSGVSARAFPSTEHSLTIEHTIIANNHDIDGIQLDVYEIGTAEAINPLSHHNLIGVDTGFTGITNGINGNIVGTDTMPVDPMLGPLQDNGGPTLTHAPLAGSSVIDAGDPAFVPPPHTDQRGYYRVVDGDADMTATIDIGAVEYGSVAPLPGDGNLDQVVDALDYSFWADHYGDDPADNPPGAPLNGDYNDDGVVDGLDYLLWAANYGASLATATVAAQSSPVQDVALVAESDATTGAAAGGSLPYGGDADDHAVMLAVDAVFEGIAVKKNPRHRRR